LLGFLITGILIGPHGLGKVEDMHDIKILEEIGVALLLFTIGIEFSFKSLMKGVRTVLLGGSLKVFLRALLTCVFMRLLGLQAGKSVFMLFLVALSSTAVVLKMIRSGGEVNIIYGSASVGILIFQNLIIVPMILFTSFLAGNSSGQARSLLEMLLKGLEPVGLTYACSAKYLCRSCCTMLHRPETGNCS